MPQVGRSGGGLFTADGLVIGVCSAADRQQHEGLYASLGAIHAELEHAGLAWLSGGRQRALADTLALTDPPPLPKQMPPASDAPAGSPPRRRFWPGAAIRN